MTFEQEPEWKPEGEGEEEIRLRHWPDLACTVAYRAEPGWWSLAAWDFVGLAGAGSKPAEDLPKKDEDTIFKLLPPQWTGTQSKPTFTAGCRAPQRADGGFSEKPDSTLIPTNGFKRNPFPPNHTWCFSMEKNALFAKWIKMRPPRTLPF